MAYSEDQKTMIKQLIELCFYGLENIIESAKAKVCMPPSNLDSEDCRHLLSFETQLPTLKEEVIEKLIKDDPSAPGGATAQLGLYKTLIEQLLAERIEPRNCEALKKMREAAELLLNKDTISGGGISQ